MDRTTGQNAGSSGVPGVSGIQMWLALTAALLGWMFDGMEMSIYGVIARPALVDLMPGHTDAEVKWILSLTFALFLWGAAIGGVIFGRLGDKIGRVQTLMLTVLVYAGFTALSAFAHNWQQLAICRFMGALGMGGEWGAGVALIMETWPEKNRPLLAGLVGSAANVGFWIGATLARIIQGIADFQSSWLQSVIRIESMAQSWRWVLLLGIFPAIIAILIRLFVKEPPRWVQSREKKESSSLRELFTHSFRRQTICASLLSTVALLGTWGSFLWLASYVSSITSEPSAPGIVAQWQGYGQIIGGVLGGLVGYWISRRASYAGLCVLAWASVVALYGLHSEFGMSMCLWGIFAGLWVTAFFGWLPLYIPELFPTRIRVTGEGFCYNIGRIIAGFGVLGAGALAGMFGEGAQGFQKGGMVMATIYLFGLIVIHFSPETKGKPLPD
ncbi:MAG TPA: MFS transporter [bacterium]|nr:MFS transporter [bacterium]